MATLPILEPRSESQDIRLIEAARNSCASTILSLIGEGISVNDADANGTTALIMASCSGNLEVVEVLLKHGADKTPIDALGYNAYKAAMFYGDFRGMTTEPFGRIMELVKPNES